MLLQRMIEEGLLRGTHMTVIPGTCLFAAGDQNKGLFYLLSGCARVVRPHGEGRLVQAGALLGLAGLMHEHYRHTVEITESAQLLFVEREDMLAALQAHTALRFYFIKQLSSYATNSIEAYE